MKTFETDIPEALRDVFAKLTDQDRSQMTTLQQLNEESIRSVSNAGWSGNLHRYHFG